MVPPPCFQKGRSGSAFTLVDCFAKGTYPAPWAKKRVCTLRQIPYRQPVALVGFYDFFFEKIIKTTISGAALAVESGR
jgi:hypothetical protein